MTIPRIGLTALVTCMCNSVASRLGEPGFDAALTSWCELLSNNGDSDHMCFASIFGYGSFVARFADRPAFDDRILELFVEQLGRSPHALRTFVRKNNGKKLDLF
ncbi:hypothetical protein T492DRAFT_888857 [Pavlovales sp. CCMP2436]|nr:hypothetical protein T492DRAFT_888857 [Pavlovales sp. CCMP2436]